jgi:alkaline phosphatase
MSFSIKNCIRSLGLLLLLGAWTNCTTYPQVPALNTPPSFTSTPKNIILLIGDGMALSQVSAGVYWKGGLQKSAFGQFPVVGFHKSHAHDELITDSAAGATAFSCGKKTFNGAIGMTPDKEACQTILEEWDNAGKATGIVVTCTATHATPAAFIAHQEMRAFTESIALEYLNTPLDCFVGGGAYYFSTRRPDHLNLKDSLSKRGYVVREGTSFQRLPLQGEKPFMLLTHEKEPPTASAGRKYLPRAVKEVSHFLQKRSEKGFFLLVEGSQIDWALHANDQHWLKAEMLDFDAAIWEALKFAINDRETLVIVTGDHECGGLALKDLNEKRFFNPSFGSKYHTGTMVPVFAFGPRADLFNGIYDNTDVYQKIKQAMTLNATQ